MPRTCSICTHLQRGEIDEALVAGMSYRSITERFSVSAGAIARHKQEHLPGHLAKAQEAAELARADNLTADLRRITKRVNLLYDACDRWLRDPDAPEQYTLEPRADDVSVIYLEPDGAAGDGEPKMVRRKAKLSRLLARLEDAGLDVQRAEWKHADPRELILKTAHRLEGQLELLGRLVGELENVVHVHTSPEWLELRSALLAALEPYPEAKRAISRVIN